MQTIEVLRDGASAQYGSDAIAGVINVRLREARDGGDVALTYGQYDTNYESAVTAPPRRRYVVRALGHRPQSLGWRHDHRLGLERASGSARPAFSRVAGEYKKQELTRRDGYDFRQQYPLVERRVRSARSHVQSLQRVVRRAGIRAVHRVRERGQRARQTARSSTAGRAIRSATRVPPASSAARIDDRNVIQIYPDGFLPIIAPDVKDLSAAGGVTWTLGEWDMDTSLVYGKNKMEFTIENTLNRSLGTASPTSFDAGGFDYDELVLNFSGVRKMDVGGSPRR